MSAEEYNRALEYAGVSDPELELTPQERYDRALKFAAAATTHEQEQLNKANAAVASVEAKLDKMREYAELVVRDAEAAVDNAEGEVAAIQERLNVAEDALHTLQVAGGPNGMV